MKKVFVSPFILDVFRKYLDESLAQVTEQQLIDSIIGNKSFQSTIEEAEGAAWFTLINKDHTKYWDEKSGGYKVSILRKYIDEGKKTTLNESFYFTSEEVSSIERYKDNYADIVTEIPFTWKFNWVQYNVSIPIKIDSMIGLEIHKNEYKIVERETKLSLYENSIIWKIWLLATGAEKFQYNIYENLQSEQKIIYRSYVLFPFDGMKNEVLMLLDRYVRFCESRNLTQYVIKD